MRVQRNKTKLKKMTPEEDNFVSASPQECLSYMWELAVEHWSLKEPGYVEQRLQRHITNLIKK